MADKRKRRPPVRVKPTAREAKRLQFALYDIGFMSAEARGLLENIRRYKAYPWEFADFPSSGITFTIQEAAPTLLIVKLSAAIEDTLDVLWKARFPEVDLRRLRYEDKLAVMEKLHSTDLSRIRELWRLRNECSHTVKKMATWAEFEKYFSAVYDFVALFQKEPPAASRQSRFLKALSRKRRPRLASDPDQGIAG